MSRITPFLGFDGRAEEAARFCCAVFPISRIVEVVSYGDVAPDAKGRTIVGFERDARARVALNGGPDAPFTDARPFTVECEVPAEVGHVCDQTVGGRRVSTVRGPAGSWPPG